MLKKQALLVVSLLKKFLLKEEPSQESEICLYFHLSYNM